MSIAPILIDTIDGATVAQLNEAARIQARKGACRARLHGELLLLDVYGDKPHMPGGHARAYMTITLLPNGKARHVELHDQDELSVKAFDETVLSALSTRPERWWSADDIARDLGVVVTRVDRALARMVAMSLVQYAAAPSLRGRRYRHAESWI